MAKIIQEMVTNDEIGIKTFGVNPVSVYVLNFSEDVINEDDAWEVLELAGYDLGDLEFVEEDLSVAQINNATQAFIFHMA